MIWERISFFQGQSVPCYFSLDTLTHFKYFILTAFSGKVNFKYRQLHCKTFDLVLKVITQLCYAHVTELLFRHSKLLRSMPGPLHIKNLSSPGQSVFSSSFQLVFAVPYYDSQVHLKCVYEIFRWFFDFFLLCIFSELLWPCLLSAQTSIAHSVLTQ